MATRDASVTDVGYEDDETEQLKLRDREAEGKYGGGRRDKSWQLVAILGTIPGLVAHTGWYRNGSDERFERYQEGQVEKGSRKASEDNGLPQIFREPCAE